MRFVFPFLLLACGSSAGPDSHGVSLKLINPTSADPFGGVTTLRVRVLEGDSVLHESELDVDDSLEVPNLSFYGVVRYELSGLNDDGQVLSMGRSAEIVVVPDLDREVALTFLPVNQVLTLTAASLEPRSLHSSTVTPQGRVLLIGGVNGAATDSLNSIEYYEPETGRFVPYATFLNYSPARPSLVWTDDEELLIYGGLSRAGGSFGGPTASAHLINSASNTVEVLQSSGLGRADPCFVSVNGEGAYAVGGSSSSGTEALVPFGGEWNWLSILVSGFEVYNVQSCVQIDDGRVFFQGTGDLSTGTFTPDPSGQNWTGFQTIDWTQSQTDYLIYPYGQMEIPLGGSRVWMAGGAMDFDQDGILSNDPLVNLTREFNMDARVFTQGMDPNLSNRVWGKWDSWIEPRTYAVGCGGNSGSYVADPNDLVEIFSLDSGEVLLAANLDRSRPGCSLDVLNDGSILISGGHVPGAPSADGGALLVPYLD